MMPGEIGTMNLVGMLIAISLLLLAGLGVAALLLAGRRSRDANADDPPPRDR
jgi:ABC-type transporter Mla maintaining outer membrane lipid asymmetry permease subunit MlaE